MTNPVTNSARSTTSPVNTASPVTTASTVNTANSEATGVADWIEQTLTAAATGSSTRAELADCVVIVDDTTQANLRWANNALTTNGQMHSVTGTVVAICAGVATAEPGLTHNPETTRQSGATPESGATAAERSVGVLSGPVNGADDLLDLLERAATIAAAAEPAEDAMALVDGGVDDAFTVPAGGTSIEVFASLAPELGRAFGTANEASQLLFGFAEHHLTTTWLASTAGTRRRHVQPMGRIELNAKDLDMVASAWTGRATTDFADIDVAALYAEASTRLGWSQTRIELPAGRYETLLPPSAVADLMIYALWSMSARDAVEGRNAFADKNHPGQTRIGQQLASPGFTMASDPAATGIEDAPFAIVRASAGGEYSVFDNGAPVSRVDWITDGKLAQLVRNRAVARDQNAEFSYLTENLLISAGGSNSLEEMVANTERGLLLTCLWYIREVDAQTLLLTGLTRDGVYLVEDGKVVGAVNNFRFNESPIDLLGRVTECGAAEKTLCREWNDWFTRTEVPPMRVKDFNMSTVSRAH